MAKNIHFNMTASENHKPLQLGQHSPNCLFMASRSKPSVSCLKSEIFTLALFVLQETQKSLKVGDIGALHVGQAKSLWKFNA